MSMQTLKKMARRRATMTVTIATSRDRVPINNEYENIKQMIEGLCVYSSCYKLLYSSFSWMTLRLE